MPELSITEMEILFQNDNQRDVVCEKHSTWLNESVCSRMVQVKFEEESL